MRETGFDWDFTAYMVLKYIAIRSLILENVDNYVLHTLSTLAQNVVLYTHSDTVDSFQMGDCVFYELHARSARHAANGYSGNMIFGRNQMIHLSPCGLLLILAD